jgi:hypothetical protein
MVRVLYTIERQGQDASVQERLVLRQEQSAPVLASMREQFLAWNEQLLPKHPMAEAINYAPWPVGRAERLLLGRCGPHRQ